MLIRRIAPLILLLCSLGGVFFCIDSHRLLSQPTSPERQGPARLGNREREGLLRALNLSQGQIQKLQTIKQRYHDRIRQNSRNLRQARQELLLLLTGTAANKDVRAKFRQVQSLDQQMTELRFESMMATREILTPEQRRQLAQQLQGRRDKLRDRFGSANGEPGDSFFNP